MSDFDEASDQATADQAETPLAPSADTVAPTQAPDAAIDLATRPESDWIHSVQGEIDDVDTVLKCLARDNANICKSCDEIQASGSLDQRPVLARCASTKQPR